MIDVSVTSARSDASDAIRNGIRQALHDAGQAGLAESQREVPVAFGDLKESGELRRSDTQATFGYRAGHAPFVEFGTDPHWPPIKPLKDWAALVLGDEDAAYAVQQKIAERGTPAQPFMDPGFRVAVRELKRRGLSTSIEGEL